MRVRVDNQQVEDFLRNTRGVPAHVLGQRIARMALERPVDVKFGPDGSLYILDMGRMEVKNGKEHVSAATGQVFRLIPVHEPPAATQPSADTVNHTDTGDAPTPPAPEH